MTIINGRELKIFSCYEFNIPERVIQYQKKVFDLFNMEINQDFTNKGHPDYLTDKIISEDFDIIIFFDIDCIPLKPNLYEYIVEQIQDNNSLIGVEQAANHIDNSYIFAGPACFAISKMAYEKLGRPSFKSSKLVDTAGELTISARSKGVNVKFFEISSCLEKKWKCGKKDFGWGTTYEDKLYHQFEFGRYYGRPEQKIFEYQFMNKCKEIIEKYGDK